MAALKKHVLVIFKSGSISRPTVLDIKKKLYQSITTPPDKTQIDLWLDSPGGDAHAAYKLALDLRAKAGLLRVAIPDLAKSAATLLTLGMDEIFMDPGADLGPLDVQLSHPHRESEVISALDVVGSLNYLSEIAVELAISGGADLLEYTRLSRKDVLVPMLDFVAQFLRPCVEQIDPHMTRRAKYQLEVGERYAVDLLKRRAVGVGHKLREDQARALAHHLVHDYPVHEFVIDRKSAKEELNLPIKDLEMYDGLKELRELHNLWCTDSTSPIIQVIDMPKKKKKPLKNKKTLDGKRTKKRGTKHAAKKPKIKGVA